MSAVMDANLIAALVLPLPHSDQATQKVVAWKQAGLELLAPLLLEYEVAAILRKAVVAQWLTTDQMADVCFRIFSITPPQESRVQE